MYVKIYPGVDKMPLALPVIAETDYDLWRDMIPALPATYAEWLLQYACALSALPDAAEIAIAPAEFHPYWVQGSAGTTAPDAALLARCVAHKLFQNACTLYPVDDWRLPAPSWRDRR
jgi:hypothetical protein